MSHFFCENHFLSHFLSNKTHANPVRIETVKYMGEMGQLTQTMHVNHGES